jgi:hypothetical protein
MPLFSIERAIHHIPRIAQGSRQLAVEVRIVFDDEEAQSEVPPGGGRKYGLATEWHAFSVCH